MIATLLSFLGIGGVASIVLGIVGKLGLGTLTGWLGGGGIIATLVIGLVQVCVKIVDTLLFLVKWFLENIALPGVKHIVKSVSATIVVLGIAWGSYLTGAATTWRFFSRSVEPPTQERSSPVPLPTRKEESTWSPGDYIRRSLGG